MTESDRLAVIRRAEEWLNLYRDNELFWVRDLLALVRGPQEELTNRPAAHMCRDEHPTIWHNDSSSEMCPLCRAFHRVDEAEQALTALREERDQAWDAYNTLVDDDLFNANARARELEARLTALEAETARRRQQGLTFDELHDTNKQRCEAAFHQVDEWKPWEWTNAMAGECGEACNVSKKMNRIWPANQFKQNWNKPEDQRLEELAERLADEVADTVIYADLLLTSIGRSLSDAIVRKFNEKSDEIGSPIKLAADLRVILEDKA